jgi:hypothetical protein
MREAGPAGAQCADELGLPHLPTWTPRHPPPAAAFAGEMFHAGLSPQGAFNQGAAVTDPATFPGLGAKSAVKPELLAAHKGGIPRPRIRQGALRGRASAKGACRRLRSLEHPSHPLGNMPLPRVLLRHRHLACSVLARDRVRLKSGGHRYEYSLTLPESLNYDSIHDRG